MKRVLIVFAKEPESGKVKTRLRKHLTEVKLLGLYKAFLKDTIETARKVRCGKKILAYISRREPLFIKRISRGFTLYRQKGRGLGARMHNAFVYAKNNEAEKTVIVGSDSPTLPYGFIETAFLKLNSCDLVLGPAADGGYYLVGLKEPCRALFKGVEWSRRSVLDETLKRAQCLGKKIRQLNRWYDVDNRESLFYLKGELAKEKNKNTAKYTRRFLRV